MKETVNLDEDRRFVVDAAFLAKLGVVFPSDATTHIWAFLAEGRLQMLPKSSRLARLRDAYQPDRSTLPWDASGHEAANVERIISSFISVGCRPHGHKIRCTLPAEVVDIGLFVVPQDIVCVLVNEILEIWPLSIWPRSEWVRANTISDVRAFTKQAGRVLNFDSDEQERSATT